MMVLSYHIVRRTVQSEAFERITVFGRRQASYLKLIGLGYEAAKLRWDAGSSQGQRRVGNE